VTEPGPAYLTPEARARVEIDRMLAAAGWSIQPYSKATLSAARGVAVREFVLTPPHGRADYLLFVDGQAVGVIEAKKEGETLTGVGWQTAKYLDGLPDHVPTAVEGALPFAYQSTGVETRFTNTLDPDPASRPVFWFHRPETLAAAADLRTRPLAPTLRHRLRAMPRLDGQDARGNHVVSGRVGNRQVRVVVAAADPDFVIRVHERRA
jgi:type I restriction enzyme R subunit